MHVSAISGYYIPYYAVGANAVLCVFIVFAIWRYNLFNLNPAIAAENIIAAMPDSMVLTETSGKIVRVNPSLTNLLGYNERELVGKQINQFFKETNSYLFLDIAQKPEIKNFETQIVAKNNSEKPVSVSSSLIKNKWGENIGVALIIHDLTRRKLNEEKIIRNERFAAIGELAGMVGHDLRNPLNSIQAATYYIKKKCSKDMDDTSREMLEVIQTSIQYSNKIVNDLLDYSREIHLALEEATPKDLAENALAFVTAPPNIKIVNRAKSLPTLLVDKVQLSRVFVNMIKNAFEAMPNGGTLTMSSAATRDTVTISFKDTGIGMSQEIVDKLWRPLFTTKAKGMGFGLPICKRIVEAHGGKIQVTSALGKGTVFTVALPLNKRQSTFVEFGAYVMPVAPTMPPAKR